MTTTGRTRLVLAAGAAAALLLAVFAIGSTSGRTPAEPPIDIDFEPSDPALGALPVEERVRMLDELQGAEEERFGVAEAARRRALREQLLDQRTR